MSRGFNIGVNDYREVQFGRLNALEINFNPDGSMDKVYNIYHSGNANFVKTEHIRQVPEF